MSSTSHAPRSFGGSPATGAPPRPIRTRRPATRAIHGWRSPDDADGPLLPAIVGLIFSTPLSAFGGRPLTAVLDPGRASPASLLSLAREAGDALFTSEHWIRKEHVRLLALTGYLVAERPERTAEILARQDVWMRRLGELAARTG